MPILIAILGTAFLLGINLLVTCMFWYCIDDYLAQQLGAPWLGRVPPYVVAVFTMFVRSVLEGMKLSAKEVDE